MFNKFVLVILVSVVVVFFPTQADVVMQWILMFHAQVVDFLATLFSDGQLGRVMRDLLGLLIFPILVGLIPAILYWVARRRFFPYFGLFVWSAWLLQIGALLVLHKV